MRASASGVFVDTARISTWTSFGILLEDPWQVKSVEQVESYGPHVSPTDTYRHIYMKSKLLIRGVIQGIV